MKTFKTRRFLIAIILILLFVDAVVLGFFIVRNKPAVSQKSRPQYTSVENVLREDVNFTADQLDRYQSIRTTEFEKLKPLFGAVRKSKDSLYSLLYHTQVPDSLIQIRGDEIAKNQKELDLRMFSYFRKIRELCTTEQLPQFDSSMKKVIMRMTSRRNRDHGHEKK